MAYEDREYYPVSGFARGRRPARRPLPHGPRTAGDRAEDARCLPPGSAALRPVVRSDGGGALQPGDGDPDRRSRVPGLPHERREAAAFDGESMPGRPEALLPV